MFTFDQEHLIDIEIDDIILKGNLYIPATSTAIVVFVHGSGSGRLSPRNKEVAQALNQQGFATLLFDLLTLEEEAVDVYTREYRFNISLLAQRLVAVTNWFVTDYSSAMHLPHLNLGYFGASTGAAAALIAAAKLPAIVKAVVSRGGRPDLAAEFLSKVKAPTLLLVGGWDDEVIMLNEQAQAQLTAAVNTLTIIPAATHLFEEPGKLEEVVRLADEWFRRYL